jgi:hypothetical protein
MMIDLLSEPLPIQQQAEVAYPEKARGQCDQRTGAQ